MHQQNTPVLKNFIVIEGIDGAGTSTQLKLLEDKLRGKNIPYFFTYEPTKGAIGNLIREILQHKKEAAFETIAYLFAADRNEHVYCEKDGIIAHLKKGEAVVSDRYFFSSLAYQGVTCDFEWVCQLNARFPLPEYLIYIDTPVEISQARLENRHNIELFEKIVLQEKVYNMYKKSFSIFKNTGMKLIIIDGRLKVKEILDKIWKKIKDLPIIQV